MWTMKKWQQQQTSRSLKQNVLFANRGAVMDLGVLILMIKHIKKSSGILKLNVAVVRLTQSSGYRHCPQTFLSPQTGDRLKSNFICNECGYGTSSLEALQVSDVISMVGPGRSLT